MNRMIRPILPYFLAAFLFSLFINTLYLTFPLYMLAVYSRVLDSFSIATLKSVTLMALAALLVFGILDVLRSRLLTRAGIRIHRLLSRPVMKEMIQALSQPQGEGYARGMQDIDTLRQFFSGNAMTAFFDIPWIFIYLFVIFLIHPMLGLTAAFGAAAVLAMGLAQARLVRQPYEAAGRRLGKEQLIRAAGTRTAEEVTAMGMAGGLATRTGPTGFTTASLPRAGVLPSLCRWRFSGPAPHWF